MIFQLQVTVGTKHLPSVARALVHTILFQRAIRGVNVVDVPLEFVDVYYPRVVDAAIEREVDAAVPKFVKAVEDASATAAKLIVQFAPQSQSWSFSRQSDAWETWTITFNIVPEAQITSRALEKDLLAALQHIVQSVCENQDELPVTDVHGAMPFHFKITYEQPKSSFVHRVLGSIVNLGPPMAFP